VSIELLRRLPLLAGLSEPDLEQLYAQARILKLPERYLLIEEGTPGDALYILLNGSLEVTKRSGARPP
jgi:CRP-like cAMP-binding protein